MSAKSPAPLVLARQLFYSFAPGNLFGNRTSLARADCTSLFASLFVSAKARKSSEIGSVEPLRCSFQHRIDHAGLWARRIGIASVIRRELNGYELQELFEKRIIC